MMRFDKTSFDRPFRRALYIDRARRLQQAIYRAYDPSLIENNLDKLSKYAGALQFCGAALALRNYLEGDELDNLKTKAYYSCNHRSVCPLCAIRIARKKAIDVINKLSGLMKDHWQLVTITQPPPKGAEDNLEFALESMLLTHKRFLKAWRNGRTRQTKNTFFNHYHGGIFNVEIKRSKDGHWHPHIHYLMHGRGPTTDQYKDKREHPLSIELMGRNPLKGFICDVRDVGTDENDKIKSVFEVTKYIHDFKLAPKDVWVVADVCYGRRLAGSFGSLRGLKINKPCSADDDLSTVDERDYLDILMLWVDEAIGYLVDYRRKGEPFPEYWRDYAIALQLDWHDPFTDPAWRKKFEKVLQKEY